MVSLGRANLREPTIITTHTHLIPMHFRDIQGPDNNEFTLRKGSWRDGKGCGRSAIGYLEDSAERRGEAWFGGARKRMD